MANCIKIRQIYDTPPLGYQIDSQERQKLQKERRYVGGRQHLFRR